MSAIVIENRKKIILILLGGIAITLCLSGYLVYILFRRTNTKEDLLRSYLAAIEKKDERIMTKIALNNQTFRKIKSQSLEYQSCKFTDVKSTYEVLNHDDYFKVQVTGVCEKGPEKKSLNEKIIIERKPGDFKNWYLEFQE